jgi:hypothetical protein
MAPPTRPEVRDQAWKEMEMVGVVLVGVVVEAAVLMAAGERKA